MTTCTDTMTQLTHKINHHTCSNSSFSLLFLSMNISQFIYLLFCYWCHLDVFQLGYHNNPSGTFSYMSFDIHTFIFPWLWYSVPFLQVQLCFILFCFGILCLGSWKTWVSNFFLTISLSGFRIKVMLKSINRWEEFPFLCLLKILCKIDVISYLNGWKTSWIFCEGLESYSEKVLKWKIQLL